MERAEVVLFVERVLGEHVGPRFPVVLFFTTPAKLQKRGLDLFARKDLRVTLLGSGHCAP
jgi:hypothetical protein